MIGFIQGILAEIDENFIVLDVHGVGYEVIVNHSSDFCLGQTYKLYTEVIYREDNQQMYGFPDPDPRNFFRLLVNKVSGVGPKLAMVILAYFEMADLCQIILAGNDHLLAKCPGIGKKTAQRLILDLKDFVKKQSLITSSNLSKGSVNSPLENDVVAALIALGHSAKQAEKLWLEVSTTLTPDDTVEGVLKKIFSKSGKC